jgi:two-component system cell cycle response regulator DivK
MNRPLVLIVEDNDKNLKLARDVLQLDGLRTIEAVDGATGIELARAHHPDVVLLDIQLPDMDGTEVLARLRNIAHLASTPVVAVTAYAMSGDRERLLAAGFDDYVSKPITVRTFATLVRSHVAATRG